ncbi:serine hydrolase [Aerococcaceae bacterium zg-BR9]|uniref:serine hydrolase n=1 Tax=Aerococcaceae bacterium zg-1292 TaxID=2774330 RepID=UPI0040645CC1|nr:serine hydrolase [Aerococcaceae bacterium zg-BR9]
MKCPNCEREVRSKHQCAFCGHRFEESEAIESESVEQYIEESEVIPKTKRKNNFGRILWSIIKLVATIFIIFLLIAFGPKYATKLWDQFGFGNKQSSQVETTTAESDEETTMAEDETTQEETTTASSPVVNSSVDTSAYPLTKVELELADENTTIDRSQLELGVESNGTEKVIENYSLLQEGKKVTLTFNNPAVEVVAANEQKQTVFLRSKELGIDEKIPVTLPAVTLDKERADFFNELITNRLGSKGTVSAAIKKVGEDTPFVYSDQAAENSYLFSWFVLNRVMEAVDKGDLALDDSVKILDALKAKDETTGVATMEENETQTVEELMHAVIQQDVTAMNHLIQETGGPNAFNLWLSEHHYFSTKVTSLLNKDENGHISGAVTSTQDVLTLLNLFAENKLVSETLDAKLKEWILQTPVTTKYPEKVDGVTRRYEIASSDADGNTQSYSAIVETEEGQFIIVSSVNNVSDVEGAVSEMAAVNHHIIQYLRTGDKEVTEKEPEAESEPTPEPEVTTVATQEAPAAESNNGRYGPDNDGDGFADSIWDEAGGYYRPVRWVQREDGLYYYEFKE